MELTIKDRLILINQYKILAALNDGDSSHYLEMIEILENGYEIFYSNTYSWISEGMSNDKCQLVLDILGFYRVIESLKRASKDDELMSHMYGYFLGFDGNHEGDYLGFCRFLIEKQGKFQEQKPYYIQNDGMNSHMEMVWKYRMIVSRWNSKSDKYHLTVAEAISILGD